MNMLLLSFLLLSVAMEFLLVYMLVARQEWNLKYVAVFIDFVAKFSVGALLATHFTVSMVLIGGLTIFRTVNLARIVMRRLHPKELFKRCLRTSIILNGSILLFIFLDVVSYQPNFVTLRLSAWLQLAAALLLLISVFVSRSFYRYRPVKVLESAKKLPTVSVCIPARNETADLDDCITSVLASHYPKLEIIVLDDCSHDKTPQVIKSYAKQGVRFVKGKEPDESWLAKNAAYSRLLDEASGDLILFIGVDVRVQPDTITELVGQMGSADMLSVMPLRDPKTEASFFVQPIRYWWELGLWRFGLSHPPVLSTCWMIKSDSLKKHGGFEGYKKTVEPEAKLAAHFLKSGSYAFLVANKTVGLISVKPAKDQYRTALRTRYPQLKRRPETVLELMILEALFIVGPFLTCILAFLSLDKVAFYTSLTACVVLAVANAEVYKLALKRLWPLGVLTPPLLACADWALLTLSMYNYEFGEVIWKERNICIPLLTVEKSLPKLDEK